MDLITAEELFDELEIFISKSDTWCPAQPCPKQPIEKVQIAQIALKFAIGLLEEVCKETDDLNSQTYIVDHLKIMADGNHGFLSRDKNLDDWIEELRERTNE